METTTNRHFRSIFWPLLLIAVGVILILNNMNIIPGDMGLLLIRLWPLIFIIGGLDNIFRGEGIAGAILMIGLGSLFLLGNFGYIRYGALELLLRLWPVFLIAIGLDVLFRGVSPMGTIAGVLLSILLVAAMFWYAITLPTIGSQPANINQPLGNAKQAQIYLEPRVGELELSGSAASGSLVEANVEASRGEQIGQQYRVEGGVAKLDLTSEGQIVTATGFGRLNTWDLMVNSSIPVEIKTDMGVGKQVYDLSQLQVTNLDAQVGVGTIEVTIPSQAAFQGTLKTGVGAMVLRVPRNTRMHIRLNSGLTAYELPDGYQRTENDIYSPGVSGSQAEVNLTIDLPMGNLQIMYSD